MTVTVYTKKPCVQCDATIRRLDQKKIPYVLAEFDAEAVARFKAQGFLQAPVVVAGDRVWSGFSPDKIDSLLVGPVVRDVRVRVVDPQEREGNNDRG